MRYLLLFTLLLCASSCSLGRSVSPPEVVPSVSLSRYAGCWYEIASVPMFFQKGCVATTAKYEVLDGSALSVRNRCRSETFDGDVKEVNGEARIVDSAEPAKLQVRFDTWWGVFAKGRYWIVMLDPDYHYSVVSGPERSRIWILSRKPEMSNEQYERITTELKARGFNTDDLVRTPQPPGGEAC